MACDRGRVHDVELNERGDEVSEILAIGHGPPYAGVFRGQLGRYGRSHIAGHDAVRQASEVVDPTIAIVPLLVRSVLRQVLQGIDVEAHGYFVNHAVHGPFPPDIAVDLALYGHGELHPSLCDGVPTGLQLDVLSILVVARVHRVRVAGRGHVRMELVEDVPGCGFAILPGQLPVLQDVAFRHGIHRERRLRLRAGSGRLWAAASPSGHQGDPRYGRGSDRRDRDNDD